MSAPTRSQGVHGSGARAHSDEDGLAVLRVVRRYHGGGERVTVEEIAAATGLGGRTVRACLSAMDGVDVLLGADDAGVYVARCAEDAERLTGRLPSQAERMLERVERRRAAEGDLPRRQSGLWE